MLRRPESTAKDGKDSSADDDEEVSEQSTADMESKVYSEQPIKKRKISLRKMIQRKYVYTIL